MPIRVLIADPDEALLRSYRRFLSRNGFHVVTATSGVDCSEKLRTFDPDVVVMELHTPWEGDNQQLSVLHADFQLPPVPIIVLMSREDSHVEVVMASPMVTDCHIKPLPPDQLAKLIRRSFADLSAD